MLLKEACDRYIFWLQYGRERPATAQTLLTVRKVVKMMLRIWENCSVTSINQNKIMALKKSMYDRGNSLGYVEKHLIYLRSLCRFLREVEHLKVIKPSEIRLPKRIRKPVDYLTFEQLKDMFEHIGTSTIEKTRLAAFCVLILDAGLRASELLLLDRNSIDYADGKLRLTGKGGKEALVFFHEWSLSVVKKYLALRTDNHPALFVSHYDGQHPTRWKYDCMSRYFRELSIALDFRITAHILRKTAATTMQFNEANLRDIQNFLRHSLLSTTEFYLGVDYKKQREVHDKYVNYDSVVEAVGALDFVDPWAKKAGWAKCRGCGTNKRRHASHGYCDICNIKEKRKHPHLDSVAAY